MSSLWCGSWGKLATGLFINQGINAVLCASGDDTLNRVVQNKAWLYHRLPDFLLALLRDNKYVFMSVVAGFIPSLHRTYKQRRQVNLHLVINYRRCV